MLLHASARTRSDLVHSSVDPPRQSQTHNSSGVPFQYDWRSKAEPLLWIADAVFGIASEHLLSGDNEIFDRLANAGIVEVANG